MSRLRRKSHRTGRPRHARRSSIRRRVLLRITLSASILAVAAGLGIGGYIGWFYWRSDHVGGELVKKEQKAINAGSARAGACPHEASGTPSPDPSSSSLLGIVEAPSIDLLAPVVQGVGNSQLDVAVGHLPASALPGQDGTGVLSAHDVTWFSQISRLRPGDQILFERPCFTLRYRVESGQVVSAGAPIFTSSASKLALVTCYPLNALFITSKRYVVTATLEAVTSTGQPTVAAPRPTDDPVSVPVPSQLLAQGLTLATNDAPLGTLGFEGNPPLTVTESPLPIQLETTLLELYFAAIRSGEQNRPTWWAEIAPGVPFSSGSPLAQATISVNNTVVDPILSFSGASFTGGRISSEPTIVGGRNPGTYHVTMTATVKGSHLLLSSWSMTRQIDNPATPIVNHRNSTGGGLPIRLRPSGSNPVASVPTAPTGSAAPTGSSAPSNPTTTATMPATTRVTGSSPEPSSTSPTTPFLPPASPSSSTTDPQLTPPGTT